MLTYQYHCSANQRTVDIQHGMREQLTTWGDVCARGGFDPGDTPADTPVERLISGGLQFSVSGGTPTLSAPLPMAGCCGNPAGCHRHQ